MPCVVCSVYCVSRSVWCIVCGVQCHQWHYDAALWALWPQTYLQLVWGDNLDNIVGPSQKTFGHWTLQPISQLTDSRRLTTGTSQPISQLTGAGRLHPIHHNLHLGSLEKASVLGNRWGNRSWCRQAHAQASTAQPLSMVNIFLNQGTIHTLIKIITSVD